MKKYFLIIIICFSYLNLFSEKKPKLVVGIVVDQMRFDFIERFCSKLNLGKNIVKICKHVCEKADEYNLVSKCIPPSIAAGSIFLVCNILNINISKKEISTTCKISEVTISKCYKSLLKYHKYLFPEDIIKKLYS